MNLLAELSTQRKQVKWNIYMCVISFSTKLVAKFGFHELVICNILEKILSFKRIN